MKRNQVYIATGHAHSGCRGYFEETDDGCYADAIRILGTGPLMVKVHLEDCSHGTDACFAEPKFLRPDGRVGS